MSKLFYPYKEPPCCDEFKDLVITREIDILAGKWTIYTTNNDNYGPRYQHINFCPFCGKGIKRDLHSVLKRLYHLGIVIELSIDGQANSSLSVLYCKLKVRIDGQSNPDLALPFYDRKKITYNGITLYENNCPQINTINLICANTLDSLLKKHGDYMILDPAIYYAEFKTVLK